MTETSNASLSLCMSLCYGYVDEDGVTHDCASIALKKGTDNIWKCHILNRTFHDQITSPDSTSDSELALFPEFDDDYDLNEVLTSTELVTNPRRQMILNAPYWTAGNLGE